MAFEFIKEELCEARYIRTPRDAIGRSGDNISETFYEHLLVLQQMRFENPQWAQKYAKDTLKYMSFTNVRTGATDLHNLASIINNPSKFSGKVDGLPGRFDELQTLFEKHTKRQLCTRTGQNILNAHAKKPGNQGWTIGPC